MILVSTMVFVLIDLANPKSHNLTIPLAEIRMFCGFISKCQLTHYLILTSVNDPVGVQIVQCEDQLLCDLPDLCLRQTPVIFEYFKKFSLSELSDDTELVRCLEGIEKEDDVLVVETFENLNLLSEVVEFFLCFAPIECEYLRG